MSVSNYSGNELEIFAHAKNWKSYYYSFLKSYLGNRVLEVGAGLGATTAALNRGQGLEWLCLEPDGALLQALQDKIKHTILPSNCRALQGTLQDVPDRECFDSVLYIDVLEHIESDHAEVVAASAHLNAGGFLVVLSPAHNFLYSPFDRAIGHYRRYTKSTLAEIPVPGCELTRLFYLDSCGLLLSAANRILLRQSMPTQSQICFWDGYIIPLSRIVDPLFGFRLGKSVVAIWKKV